MQEIVVRSRQGAGRRKHVVRLDAAAYTKLRHESRRIGLPMAELAELAIMRSAFVRSPSAKRQRVKS